MTSRSKRPRRDAEEPQRSSKRSKRVSYVVEHPDNEDLEVIDLENDADTYVPPGPSDNRKRIAAGNTRYVPESQAKVSSLASDAAGGGTETASDRLARVDKGVLEKIKKALRLGIHETTSEAEARNAMRNASRLMALHNVEQADIFAAEDDAEKLKRAGQSTVSIHFREDCRVVLHAWSCKVVEAMEIFFVSKSYNSKLRRNVVWTFYGLVEQTAAAAIAFEMVYNLIVTWSDQNKGANSKIRKNIYCHGVAQGLYELAKKDWKEENRRAIEKEEARIQAAAEAEAEELAGHNRRLEIEENLNEDAPAGWGGEEWFERGADFYEDDGESPWVSGQQLQLFRNNAKAVADNYERTHLDIKPGPVRPAPTISNAGDHALYKQGKEDAKTIDIKRKRVKDALD